MVWHVRGFWSCLCCCLFSVLCRAPGACAWGGARGLHGRVLAPGSSCGQMCWVWSTESGIATSSSPWGSKPWKLAVWRCDNFLSPVVLCPALPLREGWIWALPGWHLPLGSTELPWGQTLSSLLWIFLNIPCTLLLPPVRVGPVLYPAPQSPRAKGDVCLMPPWQEGVTEPRASWVLLHLWVWHGETKISVWVPKLSTWAGSTKPGSCKGWLEIFMAPEASFLRLCSRLKAKSRVVIEKQCVPFSGWGRNMCWDSSGRGEVLLRVTHLVPVQVCSGKVWALGGSQSCTEFTGGWRGKEREDCTACGQHCRAGRSCGCFSGCLDSLV